MGKHRSICKTGVSRDAGLLSMNFEEKPEKLEKYVKNRGQMTRHQAKKRAENTPPKKKQQRG